MKKTVFSLCGVAFCALFGAVPSMATEVKNNTEIAIKKIECSAGYSSQPSGTIVENLAAQSSVQVSDDAFKGSSCERVIAYMADGKIWQFFLFNNPDTVKKLHVEFSPLGRYSKENTQPSILIEKANEVESIPAGIDFSGGWQLIGSGTSLEEWKKWLPHGTKLGDINNNFLSFGGISWDIKENSIVSEEGNIVSVQFTAPLTNSVIMPMVKRFKDGGFVLQKFTADGQVKELQSKGEEAMTEAFFLCADAKTCEMHLKSDYATLTLTLPGDDNMVLYITK